MALRTMTTIVTAGDASGSAPHRTDAGEGACGAPTTRCCHGRERASRRSQASTRRYCVTCARSADPRPELDY